MNNIVNLRCFIYCNYDDDHLRKQRLKQHYSSSEMELFSIGLKFNDDVSDCHGRYLQHHKEIDDDIYQDTTVNLVKRVYEE